MHLAFKSVANVVTSGLADTGSCAQILKASKNTEEHTAMASDMTLLGGWATGQLRFSQQISVFKDFLGTIFIDRSLHWKGFFVIYTESEPNP